MRYATIRQVRSRGRKYRVDYGWWFRDYHDFSSAIRAAWRRMDRSGEKRARYRSGSLTYDWEDWDPSGERRAALRRTV